MNSSRFLRYSAAVTSSAALAPAANAAFASPYVMDNGSYPADSITADLGDWNYAINSSFPALTLNVGLGEQFVLNLPTVSNFGPYAYDLTVPAIADGLVSFDVNGSAIGANTSFAFIINGTPVSFLASNSPVDNSFSFPVTSGDVFGFRLSFNYNGGAVNANLAVSNLTVVPEPATTAAWMAAGALGLLGVRAARRRAALKA